MTKHDSIAWPVARMVEALEHCARHAGFPGRGSTEAMPTWEATGLGDAAFDRWTGACAEWVGVDAEPVDVAYHEVESLLRRAAPAIIRLPSGGGLLAVVRRRGRRLTLLTPLLEKRNLTVEQVASILKRPVEAPVEASTDAWLRDVVADPSKRERVCRAVANEVLETQTITRCFLLRLPPGASFVAQLRADGVLRDAAALIALDAGQYVVGLSAWYTLGSGAFTGSVEHGWLLAWGLLLLTMIPLQVGAVWLQGRILLVFGALLKRRLLAGTLRLDQDALRREGAGQLLGRALDAGALEALVLSGALFALLAFVELAILSLALLAGPGGALQVVALVLWTAVTLALAWRGYRRMLMLTRSARDITGNLVEQMAGHRTRLAQQVPERWHDGEDDALERYLTQARAFDRNDSVVRGAPQGWALVGVGTLIPTLLAGGGAADLAIAVGGVVLGAAAFARLSSGLGQLASAACAWKNVEPVFQAAGRLGTIPSPDVVLAHGVSKPAQAAAAERDVPLIDASDLHYAYPSRAQPILRGGSIRIRHGDRVLVQGSSGGGKSTFASILAGLRKPQSGLLLLGGLDRETLGADGWVQRVAAAPQYHDNHILSETLLFNLVMGRRWPPTPEDVQDAIDVCRSLGLGDLIRRMPAGLNQMVGESGWRLSHGERSRVFIARALLQGAKVVILDESFAALDPRTTEQCLRSVFERADTLVVIAHP